MTSTINIEQFIDLKQCLHGDKIGSGSVFRFLGSSLGAWIESFLTELGVDDTPLVKGHVDSGAILSGRVYIAEEASVEPTAMIQGPTYIGPGTQVRHGAYIRGMVYAGSNCVLGHATEVKGAMFFDDAKAGHFAYVGDAVLGRHVNLGAGTKLANLPFRRREIRVLDPASGQPVGTGLQKFSAVLGDHVHTGCNSVLSPGTLLLPNTGVLPCVHYRGTLTNGFAR